MNKIKYKGYSLLESPHNTFKLDWGTKPSFGFFSCTPDTLALISTEGGGDLKFEDEVRSVTLKYIYFVKASLNPKTLMYDIVLADKRILWQNRYHDADYNTYKSTRVLNGNDYDLENLKVDAVTHWTYADILAELDFSDDPGSVSLTLFRAAPREPRNIRGIGVSYADLIQQLLYELNCFLVLDPVGDQYHILPIGMTELADLSDLTNNEKYISWKQDITPGLLWKPVKIRAFIGSSTKGRYDSVEATITGGSFGERGFVTSYAKSTNGTSYATQFAQELAEEYKQAANWYKTCYVGIHPIIPSTTATSIIWSSGVRGATTTILREFPLLQPDPIRSHLFAYDGYAADGGALSKGEFQWQHYMMVSNNQSGWDDPRASAILEDEES